MNSRVLRAKATSGRPGLLSAANEARRSSGCGTQSVPGRGKRLELPSRKQEDFAAVRLLETGMPVQISCSNKLPVGCDTIITGAFHGTKGTVGFQNLNGSLNRFTTTPWSGKREKTTLSTSTVPNEPPALQWVRQLGQKACYTPEIENLIPLAATLDRIYGR